jgi:hypothetical protein
VSATRADGRRQVIGALSEAELPPEQEFADGPDATNVESEAGLIIIESRAGSRAAVPGRKT